MFKELNRNFPESMGPSKAFLKGLPRRLLKANSKEKIFVIGFHKTGTSSLGKALQVLGYEVCGGMYKTDRKQFRKTLNKKQFLKDWALNLTPHFDAFQDTPWFMLYKFLDHYYPNARFILTTRSTESWIKSVVNHFGGSDYWVLHKWIYGYADPVGNEQLYTQVYENHIQAVRNYFMDKPDRFLEISLENGDGWDKLCSFLNVNQPLFHFPDVNKKVRQNP
jgi:hypothetical protein